MSLVFDVPTVSVLIASASVITGAIYYMLEASHERRVRRTESILRLSPWFGLVGGNFKKTLFKCAPSSIPITRIICKNTPESPNT